MPFLWLLFFLVPLLEMYVLIRVGSSIGVWPTIALVILTATVGLALLRREGFAMVSTMQEKMARGEAPAEELVGGLLLVVGAAFLLTPGFVTDTLGFCLLLRPTRRSVARALGARFVARGSGMQGFGPGGMAGGLGPDAGPGMEGTPFATRTSQAFEAQDSRTTGPRRGRGPTPRSDQPATLEGDYEIKD